ncbi:hypothetical protein Tco_1002344 [Tanacetum coccineum]|uniref:Transposase (putative) gypsy type domain-containing protein n=1 Tax=Tanacetum coccineum TaxID=301880 RepID=A0ABQ5F640_9ASTR
MAPESSRVVVMPKFDMHTYTSTLMSKELKDAIMKHYIPMDLHPRLPPSGLTMDKLPSRYIGMYIEHLEQGGLRIPFSTFFLAVIRHFNVHVSQLVPMWVNRVILFEVRCRSLDIPPTVSLFHVFYNLYMHLCKVTVLDAMPWRHSDTDVRDDFPNNYNEEHVKWMTIPIILHRLPSCHLLYLCGLTTACRHPKLRYVIKDSQEQGNKYLISMDDFLQLPEWNGTTVSKTKEPIPENRRPQPHVTFPLNKGELISEKNPAQKAVEKPNSKVAAAWEKKDKQSLAKAQMKRTEEESSTTNLEKEVVDLSENTRILTPPVIFIVRLAPHVQPDPSPERVGLSDGKLLFALHSLEAGLASTNCSIFPVQLTLSILHIRQREESRLSISLFQSEFSGMIFGSISIGHLEELDRLRNDLQRAMQTNDGLSKQLSLLDNVHSSCEDKERELVDQLKEMEKERDDWRRTTSEQAEMERHKLIREFIPEVVKRLHASSEYRKSLAIPVGLCFTAGWLGGVSLGKSEDEIAARVAESYRLPLDALLHVFPDPPTADIRPESSSEANTGNVATQVPPDAQTAEATSNMPPQHT